MTEFDIFDVWWGRLGLAGVLGVILYLVVKWVANRMTRQEVRLQNQIADRASEDKLERSRKSEEDRRERESLARRLRQIEEARVDELRDNTSMVVKALSECASAQQANASSRRRLDQTLREMIHALQSLPCNRAASSHDGARTHITPLPESTPPSGMEALDENHTPIHNPSDAARVFPNKQR